MTTGRRPDCYFCKHLYQYIPEHGDKENASERCLAYPRGIPEDIMIFNKPHTKPTRRQVGMYVFERPIRANVSTG